MAVNQRNRRRVARRSLAAGLVAVGVALLAVMEYGDSGRVVVPGTPEPEPRGQRGSFLLEPNGIAYNKDGKLMYRWRSSAAERDSAQDDIQLTNPEYTGGMDRERGWTASSKSGSLSADGTLLTMREDVTIIDLLRNLEIETKAISVDLTSNQASSDEEVLLRAPRGTTTAKGMLALPDEGKLELKSRVTGTYNAG